MNEIGGALGIFAVIFIVVLSILWIVLPFAIFGTKRRLDELISEQKKTNTWLQELVVTSKSESKVTEQG